MNNTKTYKRYIEITPLEALQLLIDNKGKPLEVAFFTSNGWVQSKLTGLDLTNSEYPFIGSPFRSSGNWHNCARIIETDPREVPEVVKPLPHEWLAYVPFDLRIDSDELESVWYTPGELDDSWCNNGGEGWRMDSLFKQHHYAIDVRSDFAKEHFPQIVEAMNYQDEEAFTNPDLGKEWSAFDEWFDSKLSMMADNARNHYREAYELGQQNPLK